MANPATVPGECIVCVHPRRTNIEDGLAAGLSSRALESQERAIDPKAPSRGSIVRHASVCLPSALRAAEAKLHEPRLAIVQAVAMDATARLEAVRPLSAFSDRIEALLAPLEKASRACDRWLTDPHDRDEYDIGPRSYELDVVYEEGIGPLTVRRKATLAQLLSQVAGVTGPPVSVETSIADPREYLLKVQAEVRRNLELIAKIVGILKPDAASSVNIFLASPEWSSTRTLLVEAVRDHPEVAERVALALEKVGGRDR